MSSLVPLHYDGKAVRYFLLNGEPWWVLSDVCKALGKSNPAKMAMVLDEDERSNLKLDRGGDLIVVSEPGLMKVIIRSNDAIKPGTFAHSFVRWVTHEVLPSIRKHGSYPPPSQIEADDLATADRIQGDDLSTPAGRLLSELHRVTGIEDQRKLRDWCEGIISKGRFAQLSIGNGALSALRHDDTWITLAGAGVDLSYVINGIWSVTPDERALISNLRSVGDRKAIVMHRTNLQIAALLDEDETPLLS